MVDVPAALQGLRAGQTGILALGRVIMGDIAVTLVDLAQRELLTVEETTDGADWRLTPAPKAARQRREPLLDYENRLLDGLNKADGEAMLTSLPDKFGVVLDGTRKALIGDAVRRGWLRHLRHDQRTSEAEELAGQLRSFRRDVRRMVAAGDLSIQEGQLLPYALRFGLLTDEQLPQVKFAHAWVRAFADLPGWVPPPTRPEFVTDQPMFADINNIPGGGLAAWLI